ncbi:MAG TPA: hypothetical protein DCG57_21555 [Candidatus Riflebacteria bacterium]|jgi:tetratricopeptide (TPR) repeat protein|nr:hypothetical protein [Candidatus Riflebacteria bacterium]
MRPDKPAIRAPKIALKQELQENQRETGQPAVASFERIPPSESTAMGAGDFLRGLFSRHFLVTIAALAILAGIVYAVDSFNHWSKTRGRPHHSTAVAFELPPEIENPRVTVSGNPTAYNVMAEACYIEGNKLLAAGFNHRAEKMFRQAAEHSPDNQKYWDAWQALRREADFDTFRRQMNALLEADRDNEAWEAYVNGVRRDRRFFNRFTPDFAERLVKAGHLASAASILMTYNELFPVNAKTKPLLEKIRSMP